MKHELINLKVNEEKRKKVAKILKEKGIQLPTLEQMKDPKNKIPKEIQEKLKDVDISEINPLNLFRITWKNEPKEGGGLYQDLPNYLEIPKEISGVDAKIFAMAGKFFPTGCHKVGASFACLVPRLITGQFDPTYNEAVWPSTGNYCRGGSFNSALLGCKSIAILPENMSKERFDWLKSVAGEIITTKGSESNVKEIYDETWNLRNTREEAIIFNQFEELGNHLWHYTVTGGAMNDLFVSMKEKNEKLNFAAVCLTSGSGGTLGSGDFIKDQYPHAKITVGEALQCPTLYNNGFGDHRIEGIGDKHVPWVHNVKNSDMIAAIDDEDAVGLFRLFNEKSGQDYLRSVGVADEIVDRLPLVGISGAANIIACIKTAKYYHFGENDVLMTVLTDSSDMYRSRLEEMEQERGHVYNKENAIADFAAHAKDGLRTDHLLDLDDFERERIHNLKYYTWIEQQGKSVEELNAQWYDYENYWGELHKMAPAVDQLITEFNQLIDEI